MTSAYTQRHRIAPVKVGCEDHTLLITFHLCIVKSEENYLLDLIEHTASAESIMTNKKKSKGQKDGFMKKVSSLFNIDMVKN